ncbi:hypothetical protein [Parenemella sanctibonifatiensis]|uniref:Uncharacterized protein n=1 Tax=Parenemella sanctibonifatiensis TaxID=2016505 RepID=A0A255DXI1_9ACTN|nr:hypothetical protein [Parenemella sanctibonifatiensis]OYN84026.1 hypothetical protein CGZ92_13275 [Parenemella sanctibonifatiensis]
MTELENPAKQLASLLRAWQGTPSGLSVLKHRKAEGEAWWVQHVRAVILLNTIIEHIEQDPDAPEYFRTQVVDRLFRGIFATNTSMEAAQSGPRVHVTKDDLGSLDMMAWRWLPGVVDREAVNNLQTAAREVMELLRSSALDNDAMEYLFELVAHLDRVIARVDVFGSVDVARAAKELIAVLTIQFSDQPEEDQAKAKGLVQRLGWALKKLPFSRVATELAIEAGKQAMRALPPGSGS